MLYNSKTVTRYFTPKIPYILGVVMIRSQLIHKIYRKRGAEGHIKFLAVGQGNGRNSELSS